MNDIKEYAQREKDAIRAENTRRLIDEFFNKNVNSFGREIKLSKANINNLNSALKGKRAFGDNITFKIETHFKFKLGLLSEKNCLFPEIVQKNNDVHIPIFPFDASAGLGSAVFEGCDIEADPVILPYSFVKDLGNPDNLCGIRVIGNSMEFRIIDGAIAILDIGEKARTDIINGEIYCFRTNNDKRQIKYLSKGVSGLLIKSENPAFESEMIPYDSDIEIIIEGLVVSVINPLRRIK